MKIHCLGGNGMGNGMGNIYPGPDDTPESIAACGTNPCGMTDYLYVGDTCLNYLGCADPTNSLYVGAKKGALYLTSQAAGGVVASTVTGIGSGLSNFTGVPPIVWYAAGAALILFALKGR